MHSPPHKGCVDTDFIADALGDAILVMGLVDFDFLDRYFVVKRKTQIILLEITPFICAVNFL